jgi:hypothetical protein
VRSMFSMFLIAATASCLGHGSSRAHTTVILGLMPSWCARPVDAGYRGYYLKFP